MSVDPAEIRAAIAPLLKLTQALHQLDSEAEALLMARGEMINVKRQRDKLAAEVAQTRTLHDELVAQRADLDAQVGKAKAELRDALGALHAAQLDRDGVLKGIADAKAGLQKELDRIRYTEDQKMNEARDAWKKEMQNLDAQRAESMEAVRVAKAEHAAFVKKLIGR